MKFSLCSSVSFGTLPGISGTALIWDLNPASPSSFSSLFPLVEPFSTHVMFFAEKNNWDLFFIRFLNYLLCHLIKKFFLAQQVFTALACVQHIQCRYAASSGDDANMSNARRFACHHGLHRCRV